MHEVQTFCRLRVPPTRVRIDWMLGFQRRGVRRCEYEMLLPKPGPLPQTSQVAATVSNSRGKNPAGVRSKDSRIGGACACRTGLVGYPSAEAAVQLGRRASSTVDRPRLSEGV